MRHRFTPTLPKLWLGLIFTLLLSGVAWADTPAAEAKPAEAQPAAAEAKEEAKPAAAEAKEEAQPAAAEAKEEAQPAAAEAKPAEAKKEGAKAEAEEKEEAKEAAPAAKKEKKEEKGFIEKLAPILILLIVVVIVLARLPKVEGVDHSKAYRFRRIRNWVPLGLTYMFLYMGRYNIKVSQHAFGDLKNAVGDPMMSNAGFSTIFMVGTAIYGVAFVINGPLTDKLGGKFAILTGAGGALIANLLMGICTWVLLNQGSGAVFIADHFVFIFSILYAINMYFQSFGAVAIVKCNAPWFHIRERGVFGAIFGILISLGIYFAFDVGYMVLEGFGLIWVFIVPTIALATLWIIDVFQVRNTPGEAGFDDFDPGDASSDNEGPRLGVIAIFKKMLSNPIIVTIALVEFCSGFLRQAIMQWFRSFAKQTDTILGLKDSFVFENWGMLLCAAGILGGVVAGIISDRVFESRRGPVAGLLYAGMLISAVVLSFTYTTPAVGWIVVVMSMMVIGVHGMLSGTASMDFGGKQNVGVVVGIIDGFVYAGTAFMSLLYIFILPADTGTEAANPANWNLWPISMIPMAIIGLVLAMRLWNAKPKSKAAASH